NYEDYKEYYYARDEKWFDDYFSKPRKFLESKIEFHPPEMSKNHDYRISDKENVKILHQSLKHLTTSQATQERLWAGLAHLQLRDYAFYRLEQEFNSKNDNRINTGLFLKSGGKKRSLYVHFISRLWWVGHMTYDSENKDNPYWLTECFSIGDFSARCVTFFSSKFRSNKNIVTRILKTLNKLQEMGVSIKSDYFTEANKHLNVIGEARILDSLTEEEVREILYTRLIKYFNLTDKIEV